jgi:hypothetical protein
MIGEFENIAVSTGYPVKNIERFTGIKSMFLTDPLFSFDTVEDFEDKAQWIADIKAQNIFQVLGLLETEPQIEPTEYIKSDLGYQFKGNKGKYIFNFKALYKKEYHDQLSKWSGKSCRVFFADANNNVFANKIGARIYGLDVDLINIEKKTFGSIEPAYTIIRIELSDSDEFDYVAKMDFSINKINPVQVAISNLVITGNQAEFTLIDSVYGYPIETLYTGIVIGGADTGLTITGIMNTGCGEYRAIASSAFDSGSISITNNYYYTTVPANYFTSSYFVVINVDYRSATKIRLTVVDNGNSLQSGLTSGDFTITDDLNGVLGITGFTEISTGRYEIDTNEDMTEGTIAVDNSELTGSYAYTVIIEVSINDLTSEITNKLIFDVEELVSGDNVTDLLVTDFLVSDQWSGYISIVGFSRIGNEYTLTLNRPRTNGSITISGDKYHCNKTYDFTSASFKNSGAVGSTELIDTNTDGLADGFGKFNPSHLIASFISAPSHGRMQRITHITGSNAVGVFANCDYFKVNRNYKLRLYYRRINAGTGADRYLHIQLLGSLGSYVDESLGTGLGSGPPSLYTSPTFNVPLNENILTLTAQFNKLSMSMDISRMELIEV